MATVMGGERTARSWAWRLRDSLHRFFDSDIFYSFRRSPVTVLAFVTTVIFFVGAFAAPILAPFNTNDVATLSLMDAFQPPAWIAGGSSEHFLGTDDQGRDVLSAIMFGTQISLIVGFMSVIFSVVLGVGLGLISGYVGELGRLPATLELVFVAAVLALAIGVPLGVYTGLHRDGAISRMLLTASLVGISLPTFLIGIILILIFSVWLGWLPSFGRGATVDLWGWESNLVSWEGFKSIILPSVTLCLFQLTLLMRLVRAEMLEVLRTDYVKFARARGLTNRAVNSGH